MDQTADIWTRDSIFFHIKGIPLPTNPAYKTTTELKEYQKFCSKIFFHPGGKALRLRSDGLDFLKSYYPHYIVEISDGINVATGSNTKGMPSKHYVFLTRFCRKPYYIGSKRIVFFDEEEAFLFKLCDGDIDNVKAVAPEKLK